MRIFSARPSPAIVLAVLALVFAMVGSAVAGTDGLSSKITKSKVKKIAKKQANKVLDQRESTLRVEHASTANTADTANTASTADTASVAENANSLGGQPADAYQLKSLYAAVNSNGTRVTARERGVVLVTKDAGNGTYRVYFNRDISPCSTTATASDEGAAPETINVGMQGIPISGGGGTNNGVFLQTANDAGVLTNSGFHLLVTC